MKVLVTGSTGNVGREVVRSLLQRGASVRALVHSERHLHEVPDGVDIVTGDLLDPPSVRRALTGADKAYLMNAMAPDELTQGLPFCGVAKEFPLQQIVYQSVYAADRFPEASHFAAKLAIETGLRHSGIPCRVLRPSYFFQNDAKLKDALLQAGVYPMRTGTRGASAVDIRDIGEAAAAVLTTEGTVGKRYNIVGPDTLTGPGVAATWSQVLGRAVRYDDRDPGAWEADMSRIVPPWMAFEMRVMFAAYAEHGFAAPAADVDSTASLLCHRPRAYADFAVETARAWGHG